MTSSTARSSSSSPPGSTAPSLYEHDLHESLDSMTLVEPTRSSTRTLSSQSCSLDRKRVTDSTRIPRRVKSSENYEKRYTATAASSVVSSCLLSWSGGGDCASLDPDVELWLECIPLSRKPFKNFHRDFADGVLMAEIMSYMMPKKVDLHNYPPSSSSTSKKSNWTTLNQKVFSKMGLKLSDQLIEGITQSKPGYIEKALKQVYRMVENMDKKFLDTRAKALTSLAASYDGSTMHPPFVEDWCLVRNVPGEVPDCVIYQNIKYYGSNAFDEVQRVNEHLRERNNELCSKVKRNETLLELKEAHLNDLTRKIHELRGKYEKSQRGTSGGDMGDE